MEKLFIPMSIVFVFLLSMPAQTQELKTPVHLRIASMDLGSAHYVYGATFAKLWRNILPKGSTIDVLPFAGGLGNAFVIDKGDAELGLLFGAAANWAIQGKVAFPKKIEVTPTSTGVAQSQMIDGKADIWIQVVTAGHPAVSELALSTDLNFLPTGENIIQKMAEYG